MRTTRHPVDFVYTRPELEALSRYANEHDVEQGGHYDARSAAISSVVASLAQRGHARGVRCTESRW